MAEEYDEQGSNQSADDMTEQIEDIMTRFYSQQSSAAELEPEVAAIFESVEDDRPQEEIEQDVLQLFGFFPFALTQRYVVRVLTIESTHGQSTIAQNLRDLIPDMKFQNIDEKRQALLLVHESLRAKEDPDHYWHREANLVLMKLLMTFGPDCQPTKLQIDQEELAARVVLSHFRLQMRNGQRPETWVFDEVCNLHPVRSLQSSRNEKHRFLHELLHDIFAQGQCKRYMGFYAKNKELVEKEWELSNEELTRQVRMLTLCALCVRSTEALSRGEPATVSYSQIAEALCIDTQGVERFVIEARSLGLLNAKIDAMGGSIVVKSAHHALLGLDALRALRAKLNLWRSGADKLLIILDDVRMQQVKEDREQERMEMMELDRR